MLPPNLVLHTKKWGGAKTWRTVWLAGTMALLAGCGQPGPRALLEGDRWLQDNQYAKAIEPLQKAVSLLPNNALAWNHLGYARHHAGLPDEADAAYRRALTIDRNLTAARWNLGCLSLELNRPAEAAQLFGSVVMHDPKDTEARMMQAVSLARAGKADDAERAFKEVLVAQSNNPDALNGLAMSQLLRKRSREAAATLYSAVQVSPTHRSATLNLAIVNQLHLGNKAQALAYYQRYLALTPRPAFYAEIAQLARGLDAELHPATNSIAPPVVTNPVPVVIPPAATTNRLPARTNVSLAPPTVRSNAVPAPTTTLTNRPTVRTNPPPAFVATNRPSVVTTVRTNPAPLPPTPAATNPASAVTPSRATNSAAAPATARGKRYNYLHPAKPEAGDRQQAVTLFQAGEKAREEQRIPDAVMNYEAAAKADPAFFEAYQRLGRLALDGGDLKRGLVLMEQALVVNPEAASTRFNFAVALHQAGYPADAADEFEKFYAANPKEASGRTFVANIYLQELKDVAKARGHYLKLVELEPQHPQAPAIREWLRQNQ